MSQKSFTQRVSLPIYKKGTAGTIKQNEHILTDMNRIYIIILYASQVVIE